MPAGSSDNRRATPLWPILPRLYATRSGFLISAALTCLVLAAGAHETTQVGFFQLPATVPLGQLLALGIGTANALALLPAATFPAGDRPAFVAVRLGRFLVWGAAAALQACLFVLLPTAWSPAATALNALVAFSVATLAGLLLSPVLSWLPVALWTLAALLSPGHGVTPSWAFILAPEPTRLAVLVAIGLLLTASAAVARFGALGARAGRGGTAE